MSTISCYFRSSWWFTVCRKQPACRCTKETMHTVNGMLSFVTADSEICTSCELVSHWNLSQTNGNYFTFSIQLSPARSRLTVQRTPFNMSLTHLQRQVWNIWSALDARSQVWTVRNQRTKRAAIKSNIATLFTQQHRDSNSVTNRNKLHFTTTTSYLSEMRTRRRAVG